MSPAFSPGTNSTASTWHRRTPSEPIPAWRKLICHGAKNGIDHKASLAARFAARNLVVTPVI